MDRPTDRAVLYGLWSAGLRLLGDFTASAKALQAGEQVKRASTLSRVEITGNKTKSRG